MEETFNKYGSDMMPENSQIRQAALDELRGNWTQPVLCTLVYVVVVGCVEFLLQLVPGFGQIAALLISAPMGFGFSVAFLNYMRGIDRDDMVGKPFLCFKAYGRYLGTSLLMTVYVFLWTLLFIIPGIIKSLAYAMTPYVMHDHPEMSADECIEHSMALMDGHKGKLFLLSLSFIGWGLLCLLTLGIGFFWLIPYMQCSIVKFYMSLR